MPTQHTFGALPSTPDYRDAYAAAAALPAITPEALAPFLYDISQLPVLDQNKVPACVSNAAVILLQAYHFGKTGKVIPFSPRFLDIRSNQPWLGINDGRYPRDVMRVMAKEGCATTALLPNDTVSISVSQYRNPAVITQAMRDEAGQYKIPGYVKISTDREKMRQAVRTFGPLSILLRIGEEWWTPSYKPADINPLRTPKVIVSGHEVVMRGNRTDALNRLRNSWGNLWNDGGEADYDPSAWAPFIDEAWAIAEIPADVQQLLKALPAPADFHYQWTRNLSRGQYNDDIKFAQIAFMILGIMDPVPAEELGWYGGKTAVAVGKYQRLKGIKPLAPDSIGPLTRGFLNQEFAV